MSFPVEKILYKKRLFNEQVLNVLFTNTTAGINYYIH